jgi:hypothetical protein
VTRVCAADERSSAIFEPEFSTMFGNATTGRLAVFTSGYSYKVIVVFPYKVIAVPPAK